LAVTDVHIQGPETFRRGKTQVLSGRPEIGIDVAALVLEPGGKHSELSDDCETVVVLLEGGGVLEAAGMVARCARRGPFADPASALRAPAGVAWGVRSGAEGALLLVATAVSVARCDALLAGADCVGAAGPSVVGSGVFRRRVWPLVAGGTLLVGETVAEGWSSYPPHHHPQPEVYFYRFDPPQGFGFAQVGERAEIVRHNSAICIPPDADHAQSAAPGYAQYYLWVIRNLGDAPYTAPIDAPEHAWLLDPGKRVDLGKKIDGE
jgi:5-deoxy-glucuronate isomerase